MTTLNNTLHFLLSSCLKKVPITSSLFFADFTSFHILKIRLANFPADSVKWDEVEGANGGCPHLYGNFGAEDVVDSREFVRAAEGQTWKDVFEGETWLE